LRLDNHSKAQYNAHRRAPVAQLDRALPSGGRGPAFESRRVHHISSRSSLSTLIPWDNLGTLRIVIKQEFLCQIKNQIFHLLKTDVLLANYRPYFFAALLQNFSRPA
jgi:hypothetical protein